MLIRDRYSRGIDAKQNFIVSLCANRRREFQTLRKGACMKNTVLLRLQNICMSRPVRCTASPSGCAHPRGARTRSRRRPWRGLRSGSCPSRESSSWTAARAPRRASRASRSRPPRAAAAPTSNSASRRRLPRSSVNISAVYFKIYDLDVVKSHFSRLSIYIYIFRLSRKCFEPPVEF